MREYSKPTKFDDTNPSILQVYTIVILTVLMGVWFNQISINNYWQHTYHKVFPLNTFTKFKLWSSGSRFSGAVIRIVSSLQYATKTIPITNPNVNGNDRTVVLTSINSVESKSHQLNEDLPIKEVTLPQNIIESKVQLTVGDKIFFAGDSMMQGIAPIVSRQLKLRYNLDSINLSKPSTGLSNTKFFDWPLTIEREFSKHKDIKLLIILLGPNDTLDLPRINGEAIKGYAKFGSKEWEVSYKQRVSRIIQAANAHKVKIIWLGIPYMRISKYNAKMIYLNNLLEDGFSHQVLWLPTNKLLSNWDDMYVDSIQQQGKLVSVRHKDGIHFSMNGLQLVSSYVLEHIDFIK